MAAGEDMKVVTLQESSAEYRSVEQDFRRSVPKGRIKVGGVHSDRCSSYITFYIMYLYVPSLHNLGIYLFVF